MSEVIIVIYLHASMILAELIEVRDFNSSQ